MASSVCFELPIVPQRLANLRNLLGTEAHLAGLSAGTTHGEDRERMALTGAFPTSGEMMDYALEQRAAEDARCRGDLGGEIVAFVGGLFLRPH